MNGEIYCSPPTHLHGTDSHQLYKPRRDLDTVNRAKSPIQQGGGAYHEAITWIIRIITGAVCSLSLEEDRGASNRRRGNATIGKEKYIDCGAEKSRTRVRFFHQAVILPMSQSPLAETTEESRLVVNELWMGPDSKLRVANSVAELRSNQPFWPFVCNLVQVERRLQTISYLECL